MDLPRECNARRGKPVSGKPTSRKTNNSSSDHRTTKPKTRFRLRERSAPRPRFPSRIYAFARFLGDLGYAIAISHSRGVRDEFVKNELVGKLARTTRGNFRADCLAARKQARLLELASTSNRK